MEFEKGKCNPPKSESNLMHVEYQAKINFVNANHGEPFKFGHAWCILQACPKWYQQYDVNLPFTLAPSPTSDIFGGEGSGSSPFDGASGPLRRSEGCHKPKRKKTAKNQISKIDPVIFEFMEKMMKQGELMEERREERYEAARLNVEMARHKNIDIVTMDITSYSPRKQKWLKEQQNLILGYDQDVPSKCVLPHI